MCTRKTHYFLALFCTLFAALLGATSAHAQTYVSVGAGSIFVCGYLPDGTTKIFRRDGTNFDAVTFEEATAETENLRNIDEHRIQNLQDLATTIKDDELRYIFTGHQLAYIALWFRQLNGISSPVKLPKSTKERLEFIDRMVGEYRLAIQNKNVELQGIKNCKNNKRPTPGNLQTEIYLNQEPGSVGVLLILIESDLAGALKENSIDYCVRPKDGTPGTSIDATFTRDPCAVNFGDCPSAVGPNQLGYVWTAIEFTGAYSQDQVNAAINQLTTLENAGFSDIALSKIHTCDAF